VNCRIGKNGRLSPQHARERPYCGACTTSTSPTLARHGIAPNHLQAQGRSKRQAIGEAAAIRLRPIPMTTAAMVLGVIPLITASGAGAVSRFQMGLVIASGLAIGTLFTLFVVPAVYLVVAGDHHAQATAGEVEGSHAPAT
jgi:multidrug efflux pump